MVLRSFSVLAATLLLGGVLSVGPVEAQDWRQEAQLVTTVGYDDPLHVFLDTLGNVLRRNSDVQVRRSPQDTTSMSFGDLSDELLEEGFNLNSATHLFIRYRFDLESGARIVETIEDMYLVYRTGEEQSDVPILFVSTRQPIISEVLRSNGITSNVNMRAVTTFRKLMSFPYLNQKRETALVEIGRRTIREGDPVPEMELLTDFLTEYSYGSAGTYELSTEQPMAAQAASSIP